MRAAILSNTVTVTVARTPATVPETVKVPAELSFSASYESQTTGSSEAVPSVYRA